MTNTTTASVTSLPFEMASGPVPYRMSNDYMFRAVLSTNLTGQSFLKQIHGRRSKC